MNVTSQPTNVLVGHSQLRTLHQRALVWLARLRKAQRAHVT